MRRARRNPFVVFRANEAGLFRVCVCFQGFAHARRLIVEDLVEIRSWFRRPWSFAPALKHAGITTCFTNKAILAEP